MADTLEIFGVEYTNVAGIIATDNNGVDQTYTKGGGHLTQDQDGFLVIPPDGSGGGSSDFSTVQMTVNGSGSYPMRGAFVVESWGKGGPAATIGTCYSDGYGYPGSFSVVMYKGTAVVEFDEQATITATGNATVDWKYVIITGDCTITIS